jgi:hypothetical protein
VRPEKLRAALLEFERIAGAAVVPADQVLTL